MKKLILISLLLVFILGCATLPTRGDGISLPFAQPAKQLSAGRAVKMSFASSQPPAGEIRGPFNVALDFVNPTEQDITGTLKVFDKTPYKGFEPVEKNIYLPAAIVEYYEEPDQTGTYQIKTVLPNRKREYIGRIEYTEALAGATTQFLADFDFNYNSHFSTPLCVPRFGARGIKCSERESISGGRLSKENQFAPITVSINKNVQSSIPGQALVTLDITLSNKGGGQIPEDSFVLTQVDSFGEGLTLECDSIQDVEPEFGSNSFQIKMENNRATINCFGDAFYSSDLEYYDFFISLNYAYRLSTNTGLIKVIPRPQQTL